MQIVLESWQKHQGEWKYFNGNEIGILLTAYGLKKLKNQGKLTKDSTIIKTAVTSSLIAEIAKQSDVNCIGDLLVGFKYVGNVMNKLESEGIIDSFVLGTEESHGFLMGNYARDKDGAAPAVWLAELAAELKAEGKTLFDYLNEVYEEYGYCYNYLTEIRLPGATGMDQISTIQSTLRKDPPKKIGEYDVVKFIDFWDGDPQPHLSKTDTSSRNVLRFIMSTPERTKSMMITVRPSGTEPKIKMYFETFGEPTSEDIEEEKARIEKITHDFEKVFFTDCYKILGVEFPERGFLLFWQLPLKDKLKYFDIEDDLAALKDVDESTRRSKMEGMLEFLGADPVQKVNKAFKAKYGKDLEKYLEIKN